MAKVTGTGGVFFRARDLKALAECTTAIRPSRTAMDDQFPRR